MEAPNTQENNLIKKQISELVEILSLDATGLLNLSREQRVLVVLALKNFRYWK